MKRKVTNYDKPRNILYLTKIEKLEVELPAIAEGVIFGRKEYLIRFDDADRWVNESRIKLMEG